MLRILLRSTKFITIIDDYVRLATMTILAFLLASFLDLSGLLFAVVVGVGFLIDVHDIAENLAESKPIV